MTDKIRITEDMLIPDLVSRTGGLGQMPGQTLMNYLSRQALLIGNTCSGGSGK